MAQYLYTMKGVHMNELLRMAYTGPMPRSQKIGLGIMLCGIVAGAGLAFASLGLKGIEAARLEPVTQVATAKRVSDSMVERHYAYLDAQPISNAQTVAEDTAIPINVIPERRPVSAQKPSISPVNLAKVRSWPSGVARYDRCVPNCETRDPMIARTSIDQPEVTYQTLPSHDDERVERGFSPLRGAGYALAQVARAPVGVLKMGRDAFANAIGID
jgi:hypothetical protein